MKFAIIFAMLFISACVTNKSLSTNTTTIPVDTTTTTYYQSQGYISQITTVKADKAWDYLRTNISAANPGTGSKILMIDSGVLLNHTSLQIGRASCRERVLDHV